MTVNEYYSKEKTNHQRLQNTIVFWGITRSFFCFTLNLICKQTTIEKRIKLVLFTTSKKLLQRRQYSTYNNNSKIKKFKTSDLLPEILIHLLLNLKKNFVVTRVLTLLYKNVPCHTKHFIITPSSPVNIHG